MIKDLMIKYNKLDPESQKELDDFLDFLLSKKKGSFSLDRQALYPPFFFSKVDISFISYWNPSEFYFNWIFTLSPL